MGMVAGKILLTALFGCVLWLSAPCLNALSVWPVINRVYVEPGQRSKGQITIINTRPDPVSIRINPTSTHRSKVPFEEWLSFESTRLSIEPKQQALLNYEINLPHGAEGEYFARIEYAEQVEQASAAMALNTSISLPFYAIVQGTDEYACVLTDFRQDKQEPFTVSVLMRNEGNVHVRPKGKCTLRSLHGGDIIALTDNSSPVYPGKTMRLRFEFAEVIAPGQYVAEIEVAMFPNEAVRAQHYFGGVEFMLTVEE